MPRLLALVLLANCVLASGCCHCYQRSYIPGQGPIAAALAPPIKRMAGCSKGCGDMYWGEWVSDPPDSCDPCCNGEFVGPRDCCAGRPHTRLCLVGALERIRGIRGSCINYCCDDGCCGEGSCGAGGCSSCGDGMEWSGGEMPMEYSEPGIETMQPTTSYMPARRSTPAMSDPGWDRTVPRDIPGVPIPTGRRPGGPRSANYRSGPKPIRSVSYEEVEQAEVATEENAEDTSDHFVENIATQAKVHPWESAAGKPRDEREPALLEDVLPDPRASYRR